MQFHFANKFNKSASILSPRTETLHYELAYTDTDIYRGRLKRAALRHIREMRMQSAHKVHEKAAFEDMAHSSISHI